MRKRIHTLLLCMATVFATLSHAPYCASAETGSSDFTDSSMYCWDETMLSASTLDCLLPRLQALHISDLYVSLSDPEQYTSAIAELQQNDISVYYLTGCASWYQSVDALTNEIDQVASYNTQHPDHPLTGIVFDVEPYCEAAYQADLFTGFSTYVANMVSAYQYAHDRNIAFVTVIPYWYDNYMSNSTFSPAQQAQADTLLRGLIQHSDRISVMNYYKNHMAQHIATEVNYASQYGVEIESIAEFGNISDSMGVNSPITFYVEDNPIAAAHAEWETVRTANPYENLHFSYHYLEIIAELCQDLTKYQFTFINEDTGEIHTDHYHVILPNGETIRKRTSSSVRLGTGVPFTLILENGEIVDLLNETHPDAFTTQRTYQIHAKDAYTLEIYPTLWNGSRFASVKTGSLRLINMETGTYEDAPIVGDAYTGYYTVVSAWSDTDYQMCLLDTNGNVMDNTLQTIHYTAPAQGSHSEDCDAGTICLPEGLNAYTCMSANFIPQKDTYTLEVYPKLWNGSRYASVKTGSIRFVNTETGAYQEAAIVGDSNTGYYTTVTVFSDTEYEVYVLDANGMIQNSTIDTIKYKDAARVEHLVNCTDGTLTLPKGLKSYTCITINMQ